MRTTFLKHLMAALLTAACVSAQAASTDIGSSPLVTAATADVRPNFIFILDDSGSMDWDYLPDWINYGSNTKFCKKSDATVGDRCCKNSDGLCATYDTSTPPFGSGNSAPRPDVPFATSSFNKIYYDPAVVYTAPKKADGTSYPTQNAANTSTWSAVKLDAYGVQESSTRTINLTSQYPETNWCDSSSRNTCAYNKNDYVYPNSLFSYFYGTSGAPYYYAIIPGEYCTTTKLTNCIESSAPTTTYPEAAYVRWCSDTALTTCQALKNSTYKYARYPTVNPNGSNAVTYTVTGNATPASNKTATVNSIGVATGTAIMTTATAASNSVDTVADRIIAKIDTSAYQVTDKHCATSGSRTCKFMVIAKSKYSAPCPNGVSAANVTLASSGTNITVLPSSNFTGNCPVPGAFTRVDILSGNDVYTYPGLSTKHPKRSDCSGTTCTYAEEMTNFANWYTYYRTRMQMMKTSATIAFNSIDDTYRVGYFSINNNTNSDYLNVATFDSTQKTSWYNKLTKASPNNGTPLRSALSTAGLLYGGVLNGASFNGSTVVNPIEYSCQKNFTLLSTDGYWNTGDDSGCSGRNGEGCKINKTSAIGNTDGVAVRPYSDGQLNNESFQTITTGPTTTTVTALGDKTVIVEQRNLYTTTSSSGCNGGKKRSRWYEQQRSTTTNANKENTQINGNTSTLTETYVNSVLQSSTTATNPTSTTTTTVNSSTSSTTAWATTSAIQQGSCVNSPDSNGSTSDPVEVSRTVTIVTGPTTTSTTTDPTTVTTGPTSISQSTTGGTSNTLADVAYYYYQTDLRGIGSIGAKGIDVGTENNVPGRGDDAASHQHMTTFTLGLGLDGYMLYDPGYVTSSSGDFSDIKNAQLASSTICTWQSSGSTCNWPVPASDSQANMDDLWHAAVNGRGTYFSAKTPSDLASSLAQVLTSVKTVTGASAAATTSTPTITAGDNFMFATTFQTQEWTGELARYQIDVDTGNLAAIPDWTASALLDQRTTSNSDTRTIYTYNNDTALTGACGSTFTAASKLKPFCWSGSGTTYGTDTSLTADEQAYFGALSITAMTQSCATTTYIHPAYGVTRNCLSTTDKTAAAGKALVNYLRGQIGNEDSTSANAGEYFRNRAHLLGDLVSSEAVYVKKPTRNYSDTGFSTFQTSKASRKAVVYVSGNDGMLHAFNANSGQEEWAYIPSMLLPNLSKLADVNYPNNHKYYADGPVVVRDAYIGGAWKTILVGGLGAGGRGYYALDVTNPDAPTALWEFTSRNSSCAATAAAAVGDTSDCDIGLSYGNPIVTKLANGTWVALVTSGYNNISPGSGEGFLYVLNAGTGAIIQKIGTGVGTTGTTGTCTAAPCPSGLARIEAWVNALQTDNTADRVYGGDLFGNVWRFDINNTYGPAGVDALKVAELTGPDGVAQPVTAKIGLAENAGNTILLVGTGRYLGTSDAAALDMLSPNKQSFWGIRDKINDSAWTGWGNLRTATPAPVTQTLTNAVDAVSGAAIRLGTAHAVDLSTIPAWYVDLPDNGERINTDPLIVFDAVVFSSNVPIASACTVGGYSYLNILNYSTGAPLSVDPVTGKGKASSKTSKALSSRPNAFQLPGKGGGAGDVKICRTLSDGTQDCGEGVVPGAVGGIHRVSWRLLQSTE